MEPGPDLTGLEIRFAKVQLGIELAEALGFGFDALVVGTCDREQCLRLVDVAGLDCGDELSCGVLQRDDLAADVATVTVGGFGELAALVGGRLRIACDDEVLTDAGSDHARLAGELVGRCFRERDDQLTGQSWADVLDLAHRSITLGEDVELGDLGAVVRHLEGRRAGRPRRGADLT